MKLFIAFVLLSISLCGVAQTQLSAQGVNVLKAEQLQYFNVDHLGNLYVVTHNGQLKKYSDKGDSLNVFNEVRNFGTLHSIDVTNPLKLVLYYKEYGAVVMLDRFLNRINHIDLRKRSIFQATAAGLAFDNNVWIYDEQSATLKKLAEDGRTLAETVDLRQVLLDIPSPQQIVDRDGFVYLYDDAKGVYIFDYYGALKNELAFKNLSFFKVIDGDIVAKQQDIIIRYRPGTLETQQIPLTGELVRAKQLCITADGIYKLDVSGIIKYNYK